MKKFELTLIYKLKSADALLARVMTLEVDASLDLMRESANDLARQLYDGIGELCAMNLREIAA